MSHRRAGKWALFGAIALVEWVLIYALSALFLVGMEDGVDLGDWVELMFTPESLVWVGGWGVGVLAAQAVLLVPMRRPRVRREGSSLLVSAASAGFACALLLAAGVYAALGAADWWGILTDHEPTGWALILLPLPAWVVMTPLLFRFARRGSTRESRLGRISAALFLGSVVETVAIIPIDIMVRRRTDCYCAESTFFSLLYCGTVGMYAFGPAILLPLLARRRKRWYGGHCGACGYDMSATMEAERCPECGAGWRASTAQ